MRDAVEAALKPFSAELWRFPRGRHLVEISRQLGAGQVNYHFTPRVVVDAKDNNNKNKTRFLLKTEFSMQQIAHGMLSISLCPHQLLNNEKGPNGHLWAMEYKRCLRDMGFQDRLEAHYRRITEIRAGTRDLHQLYLPFGEDEQYDYPYETHYHRDTQPPRTVNQFIVTPRGLGEIESAYRFQSAVEAVCYIDEFHRVPERGPPVMTASCDKCATDFSVTKDATSRDWLVVTVWQDFGPEESPVSLHWQSHIAGPIRLRDPPNLSENHPFMAAPANTWRTGTSFRHTEGSARRLFEEGESAI